MKKELDTIELEGGLKFAVLDAINFENHTYMLLGKLNESEDDIDSKMLVYEKIDNKVVVIEDNYLLEKLITVFKKRLQKS